VTDWGFSSEGRVAVHGGTLWHGVCGDLRADTPLLVIHGGPGMTHDYLHPLCALADKRPVIFYDQLDAGLSDRPNDPANWHVSRFLDEIDALRSALGLDQLNLLGNSWCGTLAAAYAARRPLGLERLILSSPLIHTQTWIADNAAHRADLPAETVAIMLECEAQGRLSDPAYLDAVDMFYRRHLCRTDPWPESVNQTFERMNEVCYAAMWGPNEFTCTGVLRDYDGTPGLPQIMAPTLVTCGRHDEATPQSTARFAAMIRGARFEVIEDASHMAFVERPEIYTSLLRSFLDADQAGPAR